MRTPEDYVRAEGAFLSVGADPEHSAVIFAYHHDPLVHALADRLAECLERLRLIDGSRPEHNDGSQ